MKTYMTESGREATVVPVKCALFVEEFEAGEVQAKALGYKSLQAYLSAKVADLVFWRLPQEYQDEFGEPYTGELRVDELPVEDEDLERQLSLLRPD